MVFGRKDREMEMLEAQLDYQIVNQTLANDAVLQQMRREFGPETYIVKDEWPEQILLHLAFEFKIEDDGNIKIKTIKNPCFAGLCLLHSTISQTSHIDRERADYLISLIREHLKWEELRLKLKRVVSGDGNDLRSLFNAHIEKGRNYSLLAFIEAYFTMIIESAVEGRRVQALKIQPRVVRTEIRRGKEKKGIGGLW